MYIPIGPSTWPLPQTTLSLIMLLPGSWAASQRICWCMLFWILFLDPLISDPNVLIERSPLGEFSLCLLGCPLRSPLTIHCYVLDECVYEPGLSFSLWVAWFSMGSQGWAKRYQCSRGTGWRGCGVICNLNMPLDLLGTCRTHYYLLNPGGAHLTLCFLALQHLTHNGKF